MDLVPSERAVLNLIRMLFLEGRSRLMTGVISAS